MRALPGVVIHRRIRLGRIERLVRVELVDKQQKPLVGACIFVEPSGGCSHRLGSRKIGFLAEHTAIAMIRMIRRPVVTGRAHHRLVHLGLPRVRFMAALVIPCVEVAVIVFAAVLEQVGVVGDELCHDPAAAQIERDRPLPGLDRAPWLPEKVERSAEKIVPRRRVGLIVEKRTLIAAEAIFSSGPLTIGSGAVPMAALDALRTASRDDNPRVRLEAVYAFGVLAVEPGGARRRELLRTSGPDLAAMLAAVDPAHRYAALRVLGRVLQRRLHTIPSIRALATR